MAILHSYVVTGPYYKKAQQVRALIKQDFDAAFQQVDALLFPTSPIPAFPMGERMDDPVAMYLIDVYTITVNLAGLPAVSVPAGTSTDGLPLGLQIVDRPFEEGTVVQLGEVLS